VNIWVGIFKAISKPKICFPECGRKKILGIL
jgi:hypothetical protein